MKLLPSFVPIDCISNLPEDVINQIESDYYYIITDQITLVEKSLGLLLNQKHRFPAIDFINFYNFLEQRFSAFLQTSLENYINKLLTQGHKTTIEELIDDLQEAFKDFSTYRQKTYNIAPRAPEERRELRPTDLLVEQLAETEWTDNAPIRGIDNG